MKKNQNCKSENPQAQLDEHYHRTGTLVVMDTENLVVSCKEELKKGYKFEKVDKWIHEKYQVVDKYAFIDMFRANGNRRRLDRLGWTLRDVITRIKDEDKKKETLVKNAIDLELALTTYKVAINSKIKRVLLISGDGDFLTLIKEIKKLGIEVEVMALDSCTSLKLSKFANNYIPYETLFDRQEIVEKQIVEEYCCPECNYEVDGADNFCCNCGVEFGKGFVEE